MPRARTACRSLPACLALLVAAVGARAQVTLNFITPAVPAPAPLTTAEVAVRLPDDAELWFQGVRMGQPGGRRLFTTPPLVPGREYTYDVLARWRHDGRAISRTGRLTVRAGDALLVDFLQAAPRGPLPGLMAIREFEAPRRGDVTPAADAVERPFAPVGHTRPLGSMLITEFDPAPRRLQRPE